MTVFCLAASLESAKMECLRRPFGRKGPLRARVENIFHSCRNGLDRAGSDRYGLLGCCPLEACLLLYSANSEGEHIISGMSVLAGINLMGRLSRASHGFE